MTAAFSLLSGFWSDVELPLRNVLADCIRSNNLYSQILDIAKDLESYPVSWEQLDYYKISKACENHKYFESIGSELCQVRVYRNKVSHKNPKDAMSLDIKDVRLVVGHVRSIANFATSGTSSESCQSVFASCNELVDKLEVLERCRKQRSMLRTSSANYKADDNELNNYGILLYGCWYCTSDTLKDNSRIHRIDINAYDDTESIVCKLQTGCNEDRLYRMLRETTLDGQLRSLYENQKGFNSQCSTVILVHPETRITVLKKILPLLDVYQVRGLMIYLPSNMAGVSRYVDGSQVSDGVKCEWEIQTGFICQNEARVFKSLRESYNSTGNFSSYLIPPDDWSSSWGHYIWTKLSVHHVETIECLTNGTETDFDDELLRANIIARNGDKLWLNPCITDSPFHNHKWLQVF